MLEPHSLLWLIATAVLSATDEPFLLLTALVGFFSPYRKTFIQAMLIATFGLALNVAYKHMFQVPMPTILGLKGNAFPSGHTHLAVLFWGWIAYKMPQLWIKRSIVCLLMGILFFIVAKGYHFPFDPIAAVTTGIIHLCIFNFAVTRKVFADRLSILGIVMLGLNLAVLYFFIPKPIPAFLWNATGGLAGVSIGWLLTEKYVADIWNIMKFRIASIALSLTLAGGLFGLSKLLTIPKGITTEIGIPAVMGIVLVFCVPWMVSRFIKD